MFIINALLPLFCGAQARDHILYSQFFGIEEGLSHRDVQSIYQDKQGFIWLGTPYGLNRFDGHEFEVFTKEKSGLQSNTINHIIGDSAGLMWLFNTTNQLYKTPSSIDIFDPVTQESISFEAKFGKTAPFKISEIFSFAASGNGRIIFSTSKNKLVVYSPGKGFEEHLLKTAPLVIHSFSNRNTIWGYVYDKNTNIRKEIVEIDFNGNVLYRFKPDYNIQNLYLSGEDKSGDQWFIVKSDSQKPPVFSKGELFRISKHGEPQQVRFDIDSLNLDRVGSGGRYQFWLNQAQGSFYLFSGSSFQVFNPKENWYFEMEPAHKFLANTNTVFFDNRGHAWVGTEFGVYYIEISRRLFRQILNTKQEENFRAFRGITKDQQSNIWASNDKGDGWLWQIQADQAQFKARKFGEIDAKVKRELGYKYGLFTDRQGAIWFGSGPSKLILKYQTQTGECQTWPIDIPRRIESLQVNIWSFFEDEQGKIWFGSDAGRIGYLDENETIRLLPELQGLNAAGGCIYQFLRDKNGKLWLATDAGLFVVDTQQMVARPFQFQNGKTPWDAVYFIHQDADYSFWLGTNGAGLIHWNLKTNVIEQFTKADGLSNNTIYAVYEDEFQNLWMPSDYGIIKFNKKTHGSRAYLKKDGISHNEFNRISHYQAADGALFFGSLNGITAFYPRDFQADSFDLNIPLVLTGFQQFVGSENRLADKKTELFKNHTITIYPEDRFFLLKFALLAFDQMHKVQYAYRIEDLATDWIYQKDNYIKISSLPYGKHLLRIKGQAPDGHWSGMELVINVLVVKPFYLRTWFLLLAAFSMLLFGFFILRWQTASLERAHATLQVEVARQTATIRQQTEELKALDELKSRFFANASHELRTPLTLILGPLHTLIREAGLNNANLNLLKLAQANAQSLLKLVSSILDLSKIEAKQLVLHESTQALFPLMRRLASNFESHAQYLKLDYTFEYRADKNLQLKLDAERLEIIVNNLLSNAMKFTPQGASVSMIVEDQGHFIRIAVKDTGIGIQPTELPYIFERFFQSNGIEGAPEGGGTGIGLTLCKELTQLMQGRISVESEWQKGTCFTLEIPRKEILGSMPTLTPDLLETSPEAPSQKELPQEFQGFLLLVEDNYSLKEFLEIILSPYYEIRSASNGQEALALLPECMQTQTWQQKGGLIMSDIMMPIMDGFQLLSHLKANDTYAAIPLIMLTARADIKDKLQALRTGVDDYLLKPFIEEELLARISNLMRHYQQRKTPQETPNAHELEPTAPLSAADFSWLAQVEAIVQGAISKDTLSVQWIADQIFLSERQLHRRLKSITGLTPIEYIREMRLQEARRLLENRLVDSVKKAASTVCFHDTKYFSQIYKTRFGKNPSEVLLEEV